MDIITMDIDYRVVNCFWMVGLLVLATLTGIAVLPWRDDQLTASAEAFKTLGRLLRRCTPWRR